MERSIWRVIVRGTLPSSTICCIFYIPVALLTILYSISLVKVKSQKTSGEQSANTEEQRAKRNRNVLKIDGHRSRVSVCTVLVAFQHYLSLNFLTWDAVD